MAEDTTETTTDTASDAGDQSDANGFEPISSQEALDKIVQTRLARERAKFEPLQSENEELKRKLADAGKASDELGTVRGRVSELEANLASEQAANLRHTVAAETGVPFSLLTGSSKEELEASAKAIQDYRNAGVPNGAYVPTEGRATDTTPKSDERSLARALFNKE